MRHISLQGKSPDDAWLAKANTLVDKLRKAPTKAARDKIIDDNAGFWGDLKEWLLSLSHEKCWFSEAKDVFNHWHVEHFRPKKSAKDQDGTEHDGYWWLAFDWQNFRICGSVGNSKKGTFFPLRDGCARTTLDGDTRLEDPLLLDPTDPNDPGLLSFDLEGNAIVAPGVNDEWDKLRVTYSITRCKLDYDPLVNKRRTLWGECWRRIQDYQAEIEKYRNDRNNDMARKGFKDAALRLRELLKSTEEFSAVARACILSSGDDRVTNLLRT